MRSSQHNNAAHISAYPSASWGGQQRIVILSVDAHPRGPTINGAFASDTSNFNITDYRSSNKERLQEKARERVKARYRQDPAVRSEHRRAVLVYRTLHADELRVRRLNLYRKCVFILDLSRLKTDPLQGLPSKKWS